MKAQLLAIARRNHLSEVAGEIESIDEVLRLGVGFLGEFSSGKSTLINALIGERLLPAMETPTTGSITEVEPRSGIDHARYLRRTDDGTEEIGPLEFTDIATGRTAGVALLEVPVRAPLRDGFRLVDTPGISSLDAAHRDATYGYLALLDGAVVCVDINQGGMTASLAAFLQRPEVRLLSDRMVVALCRADQKPDLAAQQIRRDVLSRLQDIIGESEAALPLDQRVVLVAAQQALDAGGGIEAFVAAFEKAFVAPCAALLDRRARTVLKARGQELLSNLQALRDDIGVDDSEFTEREAEVERQLKQLEEVRSEAEQRLAEFGRRLRERLLRVAANHQAAIAGSTPDDLDARCEALTKELTDASREALARFEDDIATPALAHLAESLRQQVARITHYVDVGKTIITAAAIAALTHGGSLAVNAAEGAVAKEAAKRAAKNAADQGILSQLARLFERVNPINHAGDLLADYLKRRASETGLLELAHSIAETVEGQARSWYIDERIDPLQRKQRDRREALRAIREERRTASLGVDQRRRLLEQDIVAVTELLRD